MNGLLLPHAAGLRADSRPSEALQVASAWFAHALRLLALVIGALHTVVAVRQQSMNEDGVNYLDVGSAFVEGDWQAAVNATWSPLYAWILGAVVELTQPSVWWEFPVVQMTNFGIFAATLVCFDFFWRQLTTHYYRDEGASGAPARFPPALWAVLGYSLFTWSSLNLIEIWAVTPDMLVAALVYLAAGLLLRSSRHGASRATLILLGVVLGCGYLVKAALFPLGIVCVLLAGTITTSAGARTHRIAQAALPFAIVTGPFVVALSLASGHVTFGDVGRFTYLKHVNELLYPHWGDSIGRVAGTPEHPPRRVFANPDVYEFAEPIGGSYPLAFDPGYWTAGLSPRFDARQQLRAFLSNARFFFDLFARVQGGFAAIVLLLAAIAWSSGRRPAAFPAEAALVVWALCAFGIYAVVFVTPRYIAPFVVLFWAGLLATVKLPDAVPHRRLVRTCGVILVLFVWVNIAALNAEGASAVLGYSVGLPADPAVPVDAAQPSGGPSSPAPEIADGLLRLGLDQGDRIGFIGDSFSAFWARLARLRIVADMPPQEAGEFWNADPDRQSEVLAIFARAGAAAVVAEPVDASRIPSGWQRVGGTGYLVRFLH